VVTLTPSSGVATAAPTGPALMDQLGLAFTPTQLLVQSGQAVEFVNSESLAHNVHVSFIDGDSTVLVADMDPADRRQIVLEREGGYDVTCDVHPGMRAFIFVTSAPYAALAEPDGSFQIPDVPPGSYVAAVWSASPELRGERSVEVAGPGTQLDLSSLP
jgi:plastocyanin